jgi:TPR repeat protein
MKMKRCVTSFLMLAYCAGIQLHAQEIDTNSIESIKIKAENGEARSETVLGAIYEFGLRGVSKDVVEAIKWFRKAAEQNFAPAQYEMGTCFATGQGVEKDTVEAVKWYLKAAGQNLPVAQYNLGVCYRDGQGVAKDEEEAAVWFRKAADQNLAIAQYNLGVCYDNGQGVGKDSLKAVKWYRKAADQNLAYAQCNLGAHYEHGVGVAEDHVEAVKLYREGAEQNYPLAQYNLGACYANGQGVAQDVMEAVRWYRAAAEKNNALAQCNLGICYANGQGVAKDMVEAVKWFRKAANQSDSVAQYNLGIYYYNGYGVAQSETEAFFWFSLAAAQGDADASQTRNIIASHLPHTAIAESQKRVASFVASKASATQADGDSASATTLLNQLVSWPLSERINQNGEMPSHEDDTGTARPAIGHDYFTVGSTKHDVLAIQGEPTTFNDSYLTYGMSMVIFQDGKVINWNSADVKLKAKYLTATNLIPREYFTVGSTREDVLALHGEPTTFSDSYLTYGMSMVMFQDGKVVNWNNMDVKLKAKYLTATNLVAKEYFTVGSTKDDVLAIQGEPTTFSDSYLTYGMSMVMFQDGKVVNWNNMDVKLKAQYTTTSNLMVAQRSQDTITNPVPAQSSMEPNELAVLAQKPPQSNPSPAHAADPSRLLKSG